MTRVGSQRHKKKELIYLNCMMMHGLANFKCFAIVRLERILKGEASKL